MKDKIYNKISTEINPEFAGWYNTDKGELFWFQQEKVWSCRDEYVSDEYPKFWYKELAQLKAEAEKDFKCSKCGKEFNDLDALAWHKTYKGECKGKAEKEVSDEGNEFIEGLLSKIDKQIKKVKSLPSEKDVENENDFVQYVTNLLYAAFKSVDTDKEFDKWVEQEMVNMSEFYASHLLLASKVSDEDIMIEADRIKGNVKLFHFDPVSFQYGAQAHRDGLIPASGKAQIKEQEKYCDCAIPYFPTGDIKNCSKCGKPTVY